MPFSGLSSNERFTANQVREDISRIIATLAPKEVPLLDWLGDADVFATSTKHEFFEDHMLPNYIVASTAITSDTAATGIRVNGLGQALTVGTLIENETDTTNATRELMQVTSVVGPNSILVNRGYGNTAIGSLAAGGQLYVRAMTGLEGQDHDGSAVRRLGTRRANTVGYFYMPVGASQTDMSINLAGGDSYDNMVRKGLIDVLHQLEKEVLRGVLNSTNSLGTTAQTRTMQGIRTQLTTINSTVTASSFAANPHKYLGDAFQNVFSQGGSPDTETWAIVAGATYFRNISDLNDTKVQDSNKEELFKRVIRRYVGPLGAADVILARTLPATEAIIIPRERVKVVPLQGRSFLYEDLAKTGDNQKGQITGEYTAEVFHPNAMARITS